jgi:hypothetical protein
MRGMNRFLLIFGTETGLDAVTTHQVGSAHDGLLKLR